MAVKSILEIDVQDDKFKEFNRLFERYRENVSQLPGQWGVIAKGIGSASNAFEDLSKKHAAAVMSGRIDEAAKRRAAELVRRMDRDALTGMQRLRAETASWGNAVNKVAGQWKGMAVSTRTTASHIASATTSLLKWSSLVGVFSALVGSGGLFGIDRLAESVAGQRRANMGSGVRYGQQRAFSMDYGRFVDADGMLAAVSGALSDKTSRGYVGLRGAGITDRYAATHNAADVSVEVLKRLPDIFKGVQPGLVGATAQARGLTDILSVEDIKRYLAASPEERKAQENAYKRDSASLDVDPATTRAWADLTTQLNRAKSEIETVFVTGLVPLAGPIGDVSKAFTDLATAFLKSDTVRSGIVGLASGLEAAAKYVGTQEFKDDVKYFAEGIGDLAKSVRKALEWLGLVGPKTSSSSDDDTDAHQSALAAFDPSTDRATHGEGLWHRAYNKGRHGHATVREGYNDDANRQREQQRFRAFGGGQGHGASLNDRERSGPLARDKSLTPEARALLDTIAGTESPDYNVEYGGKRFNSYDDHPREAHPILRGPNTGKMSDAAGRYQFLHRTWDRIASRYGLKDFSPESQDKGAWYLAQEDYFRKTGRNLGDDLKSSDPNIRAGIGRALHGTWTSLPGGIEAGTSDDKFGRAFDQNLDRERHVVGRRISDKEFSDARKRVSDGKARSGDAALIAEYGHQHATSPGAAWHQSPLQATPGGGANSITKLYDAGMISHHADGGWVRGQGGPRSDSVHAMLSHGEFVVNARAAKVAGPILDDINRGKAHRYMRWLSIAARDHDHTGVPSGNMGFAQGSEWIGKAMGDDERRARTGSHGKSSVVSDALPDHDSSIIKKLAQMPKIFSDFDAMLDKHIAGGVRRRSNHERFGGASLDDRIYGAHHANPKYPRNVRHEGYMPSVPAGMAADQAARKAILDKQQKKHQDAEDSLDEMYRSLGMDPKTGKKIDKHAALKAEGLRRVAYQDDMGGGGSGQARGGGLGGGRFQERRTPNVIVANNTGANVNVTAAAASYG